MRQGEEEMGEEETEEEEMGRGRDGEEETRGERGEGRKRQLIDCSHKKHIAVLSSSLSSAHHRPIGPLLLRPTPLATASKTSS